MECDVSTAAIICTHANLVCFRHAHAKKMVWREEKIKVVGWKKSFIKTRKLRNPVASRKLF